MINFLKFKKEDPIYPNFSKRMLSSVIDLMLVYLILTPLWHFLSLIIYAGPSPVSQLRQIITTTMETAQNNPASINLQQEYMTFINQQGYWPFIQEQGIQLIILGSVMLWFWIKYNSTPGKLILSLQIADSNSLQKPSKFKLILRMISCTVSVIPLGIGFITAIFNKENRAWHDLLSGTVIIKKNTKK
ncbi:MAG: RDD family protein [Rickettsiales bacterium]|nr:RDD family protein [Rickettsiales bacterium]